MFLQLSAIYSFPFSLVFSYSRWHWGIQSKGYDVEINTICSIPRIIWPNNRLSSVKHQMQYLKIWFLRYQIYQVPWKSTFSESSKVLWNSIGLGSMEKVPWNTMELWMLTKSHEIPRNLYCLTSKEFHGTIRVVQMLFKNFHGIPEIVAWNFPIKISFSLLWKENNISIRNESYQSFMWYYADIEIKHKQMKQTKMTEGESIYGNEFILIIYFSWHRNAENESSK